MSYKASFLAWCLMCQRAVFYTETRTKINIRNPNVEFCGPSKKMYEIERFTWIFRNLWYFLGFTRFFWHLWDYRIFFEIYENFLGFFEKCRRFFWVIYPSKTPRIMFFRTLFIIVQSITKKKPPYELFIKSILGRPIRQKNWQV